MKVNSILQGRPVNAIPVSDACLLADVELQIALKMIRKGHILGLLYKRAFYVSPQSITTIKNYKKYEGVQN